MAFVSKIARRGLATSPAVNAAIKEVILLNLLSISCCGYFYWHPQVVVIGGGLMGAGIAQVAASTGHKVTLVDISQQVKLFLFCIIGVG